LSFPPANIPNRAAVELRTKKVLALTESVRSFSSPLEKPDRKAKADARRA